MNRFFTAAMATAFAGASSLAVLAGSAQTPATQHAGLFSSAPAFALADRDDNENGDHQNGDREHGNKHGNKDCVNPAGHTRGWCKGDNEDGNNQRNHGGRYRGTTTLSGTVLGISGNVVSFRLDNGQVISILDNNGTPLTIGQHYRLRGYNQNGQFVLGGNGYNNNGNGGNQNAHVSGLIVGIGNGTITLGVPPVTINVQQAINRNATNGPLTIGRTVTAYGYYSNNVFYATSIQ